MTNTLKTGQDVFIKDTGMPGPALLVFGAIHGDEKAGATAIRALIHQINDGDLRITRGKLTMVPVCNPKAYANNTRFFEKNLNRVFQRHAAPHAYEEACADALAQLMDSHCTHLLDLHTQGSIAAPFAFCDYDDVQTTSFCAALRTEVVVTGWPQMYAVADPLLNDSDTVGYAHATGKVGAVVECGQHGDPRAPAWAQTSILHALAHLDMIEAPALPYPSFQRNLRGYRIVTMPREGGRMTRLWAHLDAVTEGETIALSLGGAQIVAETNSVIVLPKSAPAPGGEWFYLAKEEKPLCRPGPKGGLKP